MNTHSISRRQFAHLLGVGAAAAIVRPSITIAKDATVPAPAKTGVVRLSANENPFGPSAKAHDAMRSAHGICNRYPDQANDVLIDKIAKINNISRDQVVLGDGSSEILKLCAETFTGPAQGKLVVADPTFEAILEYSKACGADVLKVPLTSDYAHDLEKMGASAQKGLIYICNPNNPTASITPKNDLRDFIAKTSPETIILVDEAYFHYADASDYESVIPLVKDHPNLIVARTFSKVYGMAGLRCGYGVAQPETIKRMHGYQMWDSVNIMALSAASASLDDADQVTNGRKMNTEAKTWTLSELEKLGYKSIPSQANFIMFDCKKPVVPIIQSMKDKNVAVGRLFPAYPTHMRLTIGKQSEMESFMSAFKQVMV
ncbi:MAG TPA: aminotransferase class I/II-fold pyridoxal phosphate-dependent enzyme [Chthoniobacterales bacterium]|nr:aminotransferase class I/II-fold pyridoxal phosphate-dependent enzyme [Chthoniobacterales bacterium]